MPRVYTDYDLAVIRRRQGEDIPLPPKPRKRDNEESRHQQGVMNWWHVAHKGFGVPEICLFAVPNGGHRSEVSGAIIKREGARRGTSDLLLMAQRSGYGALAIEMKKADGVVSDEQRVFLKTMAAQGYLSRVCYSYDEAVATITSYLMCHL